jgi:hypothetical protein
MESSFLATLGCGPESRWRVLRNKKCEPLILLVEIAVGDFLLVGAQRGCRKLIVKNTPIQCGFR